MGLGLFDHRGPQYQSDGFRGIYGAERSACFVTATDAAQSFLPGPIEPGTWSIIVPVFQAPTPTTIAVTVTLTFGRDDGQRSSDGQERSRERQQSHPSQRGGSQSVVNGEAGWYGGDLHAHTPASSDAWSTGSALSPHEWAATATDLGLDFVSLTDHNVVSQNRKRRTAMRSTDGDVLLIGGEEMTNWFHGHATVTGLGAGEWLDFRQRPAGVPQQQNEARIQQFFETTRELGAYAAAAHPVLAAGNNQWQFFHDAQLHPSARPDGIEVWNGPWTPDDEAALRLWDRLLQRGWRVTASGGSDTHGTSDPTFGQQPGVPTTRVYAEELSTPAIVDGLRAARAYITHAPDGPELYLRARWRREDAMTGDVLTAPPSTTITVRANVRGGVGYQLLLIRDGEPVAVHQISESDEMITFEQPMGAGGYLRLELRGQPTLNQSAPGTSRGGMKALTNPIFLNTTSDLS